MKPVKSIDKKRIIEKSRGHFLWENSRKAWGYFSSFTNKQPEKQDNLTERELSEKEIGQVEFKFNKKKIQKTETKEEDKWQNLREKTHALIQEPNVREDYQKFYIGGSGKKGKKYGMFRKKKYLKDLDKWKADAHAKSQLEKILD